MLETTDEADEQQASERAQRCRSLVQQVTQINAKGMDSLRGGDAKQALHELTEAHGLLGGDAFDVSGAREEERKELAKAHGDTASNLGICHKRMGSRVQAAQCLQKAMQLYTMAGADLRTKIAAHLNLSACLCESGAADQALQHAHAAVDLGGRLVAGAQLGESTTESEAGDTDGKPQHPKPDDYAMLAVAYHKVAEASESLKDWKAACFAYSQAYEVVRRSLGPDHRLTRSFEKSSRCPRRATTPEVPNSWRCGKPTPRRLPDVPRSVGARPRSTGLKLPERDYKLDPETFPTWPPPNSSKEEQVWYAAAAKIHAGKRAQEVAVVTHGSSLSQASGGILSNGKAMRNGGAFARPVGAEPDAGPRTTVARNLFS